MQEDKTIILDTDFLSSLLKIGRLSLVHCLPVDPYYLVAKAEELGYHSKVITAGRAVNDFMPLLNSAISAFFGLLFWIEATAKYSLLQ
ncbi:MAG: hypothetical protein O8C61_12425 [Candidatus Methanoperedens sp.]|nr:hypothetical protein [Candidatus Methanoperedens sp.]